MRMGKTEQDGSCVDADLKVHGLSGLRVADLSVTSMLPRCVCSLTAVSLVIDY